MKIRLHSQSRQEGSGQLKGKAEGFSVREALGLLRSSRVYGPRDGILSAVTCDSREIVRGACFVAISGEKLDGHDYVSKAARAGARLLVVERAVSVPAGATVAVVRNARIAAAVLAHAFYGRPSESLDVIGITGTHGKTTTAYMVRHISEFCGRRAGMLTTVKYDTGVKVSAAPQTTPDPVRLNRLLAQAVESGVRVMPMEVSSHSLCQHRVADISFKGAVFTNLASDHLDYHKTHESYREAKAKLFEMLKPETFCVLNADDSNWKYYADRTLARVVTCSTREAADIRGQITAADLQGVKFALVYSGTSYPVELSLPGVHNVENALGAAACAISLGMKPGEVATALNAFRGVPGRLERIETGNGFSVFVDFAHTDGALATMLANVRPFVTGRLIVVFGAGGDRDRGKRPRMARAVERFADFCVLTSDNPRTEDPMRIIAEVESGFAKENSRIVEPDRRAGIKTALRMARTGDTVVIAGKGHEGGQIFADRMERFDDRAVAREILDAGE